MFLMINNLLGNAIKFCGADDEIKVTVQRVEVITGDDSDRVLANLRRTGGVHQHDERLR